MDDPLPYDVTRAEPYVISPTMVSGEFKVAYRDKVLKSVEEYLLTHEANTTKVPQGHEIQALPILLSDALTLRDGLWINDKVIAYFSQMFMDLNVVHADQKHVMIMNTHFYTHLMGTRLSTVRDDEGKITRQPGYDYSRVKAWWAKAVKQNKYVLPNPMNMEKIIIHIHQDESHWVSVLIFPQRRVIEYLDSMNESSMAPPSLDSAAVHLYNAFRWLQDEVANPKPAEVDMVEAASMIPVIPNAAEFTFRYRRLATQQNSFDCGVFMLLWTLFILDGRDLRHADQGLATGFRLDLFCVLLNRWFDVVHPPIPTTLDLTAEHDAPPPREQAPTPSESPPPEHDAPRMPITAPAATHDLTTSTASATTSDSAMLPAASPTHEAQPVEVQTHQVEPQHSVDQPPPELSHLATAGGIIPPPPKVTSEMISLLQEFGIVAKANATEPYYQELEAQGYSNIVDFERDGNAFYHAMILGLGDVGRKNFSLLNRPKRWTAYLKGIRERLQIFMLQKLPFNFFNVNAKVLADPCRIKTVEELKEAIDLVYDKSRKLDQYKDADVRVLLTLMFISMQFGIRIVVFQCTLHVAEDGPGKPEYRTLIIGDGTPYHKPREAVFESGISSHDGILRLSAEDLRKVDTIELLCLCPEDHLLFLKRSDIDDLEAEDDPMGAAMSLATLSLGPAPPTTSNRSAQVTTQIGAFDAVMVEADSPQRESHGVAEVGTSITFSPGEKEDVNQIESPATTPVRGSQNRADYADEHSTSSAMEAENLDAALVAEIGQDLQLLADAIETEAAEAMPPPKTIGKVPRQRTGKRLKAPLPLNRPVNQPVVAAAPPATEEVVLKQYPEVELDHDAYMVTKRRTYLFTSGLTPESLEMSHDNVTDFFKNFSVEASKQALAASGLERALRAKMRHQKETVLEDDPTGTKAMEILENRRKHFLESYQSPQEVERKRRKERERLEKIKKQKAAEHTQWIRNTLQPAINRQKKGKEGDKSKQHVVDLLEEQFQLPSREEQEEENAALQARMKNMSAAEIRELKSQEEAVTEIAKLKYIPPPPPPPPGQEPVKGREVRAHFVGLKKVPGRRGMLEVPLVNPRWVNYAFKPEFVECLKAIPKKYIPVPAGDAKSPDSPECPLEVQTKVNAVYKQGKFDFCLVYALCNGLHYCGLKKEAQKMSLYAGELSVVDQEKALLMLCDKMKALVPLLGSCTKFNIRSKSGKRSKKSLSLEELLTSRSPYPTLVIPLGKDGSVSHACCVVDDIVFDASSKQALKLETKTMDWICGAQGCADIYCALRFDRKEGLPGVKVAGCYQREMRVNW